MKKTLTTLFVLMLVVLLCLPINTYAISQEEINAEDNAVVVDEIEDEEASVRSIPGGEVAEGEEWYRIELDANRKPIINFDISYDEKMELLTYLKPGDIVYERNNAVIFADWTGHIGMVIDVFEGDEENPPYVLMIEVVLDGGVIYGLMTPARFSGKQVSIMRVKNATDAQIQGAIEWAIEQCESDPKKPWLLVPTKSSSEEAVDWYCSELIWAAYYNQDIHLDEDDLSPIAPNEMYARDEVATILDYRGNEEDDDYYYDTTFSERTATHHTYSCDGDTYTEAHEFEPFDSCYEKCRICDYKHQIRNHDYTYLCYYLNSSTHRAYCECNEYIESNHNYEEYLPCSEKCADCGHKNVIGEHDYTFEYKYDPYNTDVHYGYCECGMKSLNAEEHSWIQGTISDNCELCGINIDHNHSYSYTSCGDGKTHRVSCGCGYVNFQQCFGMAGDGNTGFVRCLKCNQRLIGNIIFPLDEDGDENDVMIFKKDDLEEETE